MSQSSKSSKRNDSRVRVVVFQRHDELADFVELSADLRKSGDKKLAVALRGDLLYGGLASGSAAGEPQIEAATSIDTQRFLPLFIPKP